MTDARTSFTRIYREARSSGPAGRLEFFSARGVEVFVPYTGPVLVGRPGEYGDRPGDYAARVGQGTKYCRRYFLQRCRELPRVPLP